MKWSDYILLVLVLMGGSGAAPPGPHLDRGNLVKGCGSCHRGHGARGSAMLPAVGAEACLQCHGGLSEDAEPQVEAKARGRLKNLRDQFQKPYRHPVETAYLHDPTEQDSSMAELPRHVACVDCHDPHRPRRPVARDLGRTRAKESTVAAFPREYQLCYRCHSAEGGLPAGARDVRSEFLAANRSFHPVEAAGTRRANPSLRPPWTASSLVSCTDCHGGDTQASSRAPHGSIYPGLLVDNYEVRDGTLENEFAYALCYRCHERRSILANESFTQHLRHLTDPRAATSCHTCHASHGSGDNPALLQFDETVVFPNSKGERHFESRGEGSGACYLSCHGADHGPGRYCPDTESCDVGTVVSGGTGQQMKPSMRLLPDLLPGTSS